MSAAKETASSEAPAPPISSRLCFISARSSARDSTPSVSCSNMASREARSVLISASFSLSASIILSNRNTRSESVTVMGSVPPASSTGSSCAHANGSTTAVVIRTRKVIRKGTIRRSGLMSGLLGGEPIIPRHANPARPFLRAALNQGFTNVGRCDSSSSCHRRSGLPVSDTGPPRRQALL